MKKKIISIALGVAGAILLALCVRVEAQQPAKVPRIGVLAVLSPAAVRARIEAFRSGLNELGYIEGKNIVIESRYAEGKFDQVSKLASELVRLKLDLIVTAGPQATRPAKQATSSIPIVMAFDSDPVGNGFVSSLARPGGNVTGLSALSPEITGKQLELLKEMIPTLSRVAVLGNSAEPANPQTLKETELAASAFKIQLQYLDVQAPNDIEIAFQTASRQRAQAALILLSPITFSQRKQIAGLATKSRLPAIYPFPEFVEDGGLITYSVSFTDLFRRTAVYVDKILKGAKPADLPVEQPTKFELVINLKAAKQIGLTIPPNVLARADKVIK
jgi:putative tryptophan/tyrosine transport system substrate-binding protein